MVICLLAGGGDQRFPLVFHQRAWHFAEDRIPLGLILGDRTWSTPYRETPYEILVNGKVENAHRLFFSRNSESGYGLSVGLDNNYCLAPDYVVCSLMGSFPFDGQGNHAGSDGAGRHLYDLSIGNGGRPALIVLAEQQGRAQIRVSPDGQVLELHLLDEDGFWQVVRLVPDQVG